MGDYATFELLNAGGSQGHGLGIIHPKTKCPLCGKEVGGGLGGYDGVHHHMKSSHRNEPNIKKKWHRDFLLSKARGETDR